MKFKRAKGNNSSITNDTLMKLHVHNHTIAIYIQHKFHEIPSIVYIVMAEDGKTDGRLMDRSIDGCPAPSLYPSTLVGGKLKNMQSKY